MIERKCEIDGCGARHEAKGLCKAHYMAKWYHGDPLARVRAVRGTGWTDRNGYRYVGDRQEHIALAEKALGRPLPPKAVVHHANGVRGDNRPENLVICPDQGYHLLLHARMKAMAVCGNPNWRPCVYCHKHDSLENMAPHSAGCFVHVECRKAYRRKRK